MTTYLVRVAESDLAAVRAVILGSATEAQLAAAQTVAGSIGRYFTPADPYTCADCGQKFRDGYVSPEDGGFVEVYLEGLKAIEAKPRNLCESCYRLAYRRVTGEDPNIPTT